MRRLVALRLVMLVATDGAQTVLPALRLREPQPFSRHPIEAWRADALLPR